MPMTWDAPTDAKLLRGILRYAKLGKKAHEELAAYMGLECTAIAIKRRIEKLQSFGFKNQLGTSSVSSPSPNGKFNNSPNHTSANGASGSSVKETRKRKLTVINDNSDEDESRNSHSKRIKSEKMGKE
ncbi:uncharacterized protein PADG_08429 [Paracoccidioides brasiliensis Pb18]|uniref:Uncharacterized protein n=1 Tax=Paracoccidioides brasiliensis (strain Pb18) TaxID=502780 RepID=C1GM38_PARBD|nr:uncharacterized protein PADG_08429 [Paracoccidioides brasiliensis Pb18]EEH43504.2 hypothetical protein PADG_08429 [Paracoccidioides brasiliensis Pb18]